MAGGKNGSKSGSKSSSGGERPTRTVGLDDIHPSLISYEDKILHPSEGQILAGWGIHAKVSSIDSSELKVDVINIS